MQKSLPACRLALFCISLPQKAFGKSVSLIYLLLNILLRLTQLSMLFLRYHFTLISVTSTGRN